MNHLSLLTRRAIGPLLGALLAFPSAAAAADLHVSPDGTGTCLTAAEPCDLETALGLAQTDDRILLDAGVYGNPGGFLENSSTATGVHILGTPGEARPVLDMSGGPLELSNGARLSGVDIVANSGRAVLAEGGSMLDHVRAVVTGSHVTAVQLGDGGVIRNSTIVATGSDSTAVSVTAPGVDAELRGTTVLASGSNAAAVQVAPEFPAVKARLRAVNTIIRKTGNATELQVSAYGNQRSTVVLDHVASDPTSQFANGPGATITSTDVLAAAPLFLDRANGDLRQTALSPTIDAGTSDVTGDGVVDETDGDQIGLTDLDGSPRRLGVPDIGADEREMPPIVLASSTFFEARTASLQVTVQPRGLPTDVAAEWGLDEDAPSTTTAVQATGNDPVTLTLPLGPLRDTAAAIRVRPRVSNSAGSAQTFSATSDVPPVVRSADADLGGGAVKITPTPSPVPLSPGSGTPGTTKITVVKPTTLQLPGARPTLVGLESRQSKGQYAFRLKCRHNVSCRGSVLLTRIGQVRTDTFKIPPGATRTVQLSLTSGQSARVRAARGRGLRALLEVRSLDDGSTWTAVRLYSNRL